MNWFLRALKKYAVFSGRSQRSEYWFFSLVALSLYIPLLIVDHLLGVVDEDGDMGLLSGALLLALLLPGLSVSVRRLHDVGMSGWWFLLSFVPILGDIAMIVIFCLDSEPGENRYGPNPKLQRASASSSVGQTQL
jgi:uncharacterized membrane protein YhaH (DUF805 family)